MATFPFRVDRETRRRLRRATLRQLSAVLRAQDCQTCGRALAGEQPALVVDAGEEVATASLHHPGCREPGWHRQDVPPSTDRPHLTWRAATFHLPPSIAPDRRRLAMMLVNPSFEAAVLRREDSRPAPGTILHLEPRWLPATLLPFEVAGLRRDMMAAGPLPRPGAVAEVAGDVVSVRVTAGGMIVGSWSCRMGADVAATVNQHGGLLLAVTSDLDPAQVHDVQVEGILRGRRAVLGVVAVASAGPIRPSQRLRSGDVERDVVIQALALASDAISRGASIEPTDLQLAAVLSLLDGDASVMHRIGADDRRIAAALAACVLHLKGTVHVVVADQAEASRLAQLYRTIGTRLGFTVGLLQAGQSLPERRSQYERQVLLGPVALYSGDYDHDRSADDPGDRVGAGRGTAALITVPADRAPALDFLFGYARSAFVAGPPH